MLLKDAQNAPRVFSALRDALQKNQLSHALIFAGPPQAGQAQATLALAKTLFCRAGPVPEGCGSCIHCKQLEKRLHPDFYVLEPQGDSRVIKIDAVRALIGRANLKPFQAACKMFVVEQAEQMTEEAQNAILKTLEEPPSGTYFVLLCQATERLLPTIRSRCQTLNFFSGEALAPPDPEIQKLRAAFLDYLFGGRPRKDIPPDLSGLDREGVSELLDFGVRFLRDALLLKVGAETLADRAADGAIKKEVSRRYTVQQMLRFIETLSEFKERILANANLKLALSVLWDAMV